MDVGVDAKADNDGGDHSGERIQPDAQVTHHRKIDQNSKRNGSYADKSDKAGAKNNSQQDKHKNQGQKQAFDLGRCQIFFHAFKYAGHARLVYIPSGLAVDGCRIVAQQFRRPGGIHQYLVFRSSPKQAFCIFSYQRPVSCLIYQRVKAVQRRPDHGFSQAFIHNSRQGTGQPFGIFAGYTGIGLSNLFSYLFGRGCTRFIQAPGNCCGRRLDTAGR